MGEYASALAIFCEILESIWLIVWKQNPRLGGASSWQKSMKTVLWINCTDILVISLIGNTESALLPELILCDVKGSLIVAYRIMLLV